MKRSSSAACVLICGEDGRGCWSFADSRVSFKRAWYLSSCAASGRWHWHGLAVDRQWSAGAVTPRPIGLEGREGERCLCAR
jgi:hypothetical protein